MSKSHISGLMLAAPSSGSGKTVATLAVLRALKFNGVDIAAAKAGPDYIDPGFHELACGRSSVNLDPWAMPSDRLCQLAHGQNSRNLLVEAMMGLFDGAADGSGSAADLAATLGIPVVLIVDAAKQSHSIAALVHGFKSFREDVKFVGVILNKIGSSRHEDMLRAALSAIDVPVLGAIPRNPELVLPERHLGLLQAQELRQSEDFVAKAAAIFAKHCDLDAFAALFASIDNSPSGHVIPPLGSRIAIAKDEAFAFCYPHLLSDWRRQGVELYFFSPLADEAPNENCDAIYLPGGYPELHAGKLAQAASFKSGMRKAADNGALIYGECGGYMVLGEALIDAGGISHSMLGLLNLETSFAKRKLHLGYRDLEASNFVYGAKLKAHEFHYTSAVREEGEPLFKARDAIGTELGSFGLRNSNVMGSYMHIIEVEQGDG